MKTVYVYDAETREYKGAYSAQESPLEPGQYIVPVHSVEKCPPSCSHWQTAVLDEDDQWVIKDNPKRPTPAELQESTFESYRLAVRQHMSTTARESPEKFNSISEAKSFVGTVNPYSVVSEAFQVWSANVLVAANALLKESKEKKTALPDIVTFINLLPKWEHP